MKKAVFLFENCSGIVKTASIFFSAKGWMTVDYTWGAELAEVSPVGWTRHTRAVLIRSFVCVGLMASALVSPGQTTPDASLTESRARARENSEQVAQILGIAPLIRDASVMHAQRTCGSTAKVEELLLRQEILETVTATSLDVDGVLAEIENERANLSELRASLQARRDRAANLTNVANLITGTGLGIAVNAMQFSNSTASLGNGLGVGSGIASTVLSIIGIRQRGPHHSVGRIPNMLAPLFERPGVLNSYYPPEVLEYLRRAPRGESADRGSRLDQLMAEWTQAGRTGPSGTAKAEQKMTLLTTSSDENVKLSIDDLTDRMAMLSDVTGRVALLKRDLAGLMVSVRGEKACVPD